MRRKTCFNYLIRPVGSWHTISVSLYFMNNHFLMILHRILFCMQQFLNFSEQNDKFLHHYAQKSGTDYRMCTVLQQKRNRNTKFWSYAIQLIKPVIIIQLVHVITTIVYAKQNKTLPTNKQNGNFSCFYYNNCICQF